MWRGYAKNRPATQRRISSKPPPIQGKTVAARLKRAGCAGAAADHHSQQAPTAITVGNTMPLTACPAERREHLAGGERAQRHGAEDQEIVEATAPWSRSSGRWHCVTMRGGADEGEVPSDAKEQQARPRNGRSVTPVMPISALTRISARPSGRDTQQAEAQDQVAGEEARRIHAEHVPLDAERRLGHRMAAADHGERRRRHDQVHHDIAHDAAGDGDDEQWLAHDHRERPADSSALGPRGIGGGSRSRVSTRPARHREHRLRDERRREQIGRPQVLGDDDDRRPDEARHHAAGQHVGDRLRLEMVAGGVGCGKAIGLVRRGIETASEGADEEKLERALQDGSAGDEACEHSDDGTGLQRETPAERTRQQTDRQRAEPHPEHHHRDRQRGEALIGGEHRAEDARGRSDHRVVAAGKRLRGGQHQRVAPRKRVVNGNGLSLGNRRHRRSLWETRP